MAFTLDEPSHRRVLAEKLKGFRFGMSPKSASQSLSNAGSQASRALRARGDRQRRRATCSSKRCHHSTHCSPFERKFSFGKMFPNYYNYPNQDPGSNPDLKSLLKDSGAIDRSSDDTTGGSNPANAVGMSPEARDKAFDEILHGAFDKGCSSSHCAHGRCQHAECNAHNDGKAAPRIVLSPLSDSSVQSLNGKPTAPAELLAPHSIKSAARADASFDDPVHVGLLAAHTQNPSESVIRSTPDLWKLLDMVQSNTKKSQELSELLRSYLNPPSHNGDGHHLSGRPTTYKGPKETFVKPTKHLHVKYPEPKVAEAGGDSPDPPGDRNGFPRGHMLDANSDQSTSRHDNDLSGLSDASPSVSRPGSGVPSDQGPGSTLPSTHDDQLVGPTCGSGAPIFGSAVLPQYPFSFESHPSGPGCRHLSHCQTPMKRPIDTAAEAKVHSIDAYPQPQQQQYHDCGCSLLKEGMGSPKYQCPGYPEYHHCSKRQKRSLQPVTEGCDDLVHNHENHPLPALETYLRSEEKLPSNNQGHETRCLGEISDGRILPEKHVTDSFSIPREQGKNFAPRPHCSSRGILAGSTNGVVNPGDYPSHRKGPDQYYQYNKNPYTFTPDTVPPTPYLAPRCCPRCVT